MDLYHVVLFGHIVAAVVLVSFGFVMPMLTAGLRRTRTVESLQTWLAIMSRYSKTGPIAAVLVLLTGLYMTFDNFSFREGWIVVSLVLFVAAGAIAGGVLDKHLTRVLEEAQATPDGPVPAGLLADATSPRISNFESVMGGLDIAIIFMMTNKPGWVGALVAAAAGQAIAGVMIARRARGKAADALPA